MNCSSFGKCGSCVLYELPYEQQLISKKNRLEGLFPEFNIPDIEVLHGNESHFRARAEFRIWHEGEESFYGMRSMEDGRRVVTIDSCHIVVESIAEVMKPLLDTIIKDPMLRFKLYGVDFLSNAQGSLIVTLIYHKKVQEEEISDSIEILKKSFPQCDFVVRRKGKKFLFDKNELIETLTIEGVEYRYKIIENTFTQPNRKMNEKMIAWAVQNTQVVGGDLVELYCGNGNFTIPLSKRFRKVIATEISQASIDAAFFNANLNGIENITFLALSAADFSRLKQENSPLLTKYDLKTILVDPPRAGLDDKTRAFVNGFENIIYISCNPETLKRDLETLSQNREIAHFAFFDQFPWTEHMECGVVLKKSKN